MTVLPKPRPLPPSQLGRRAQPLDMIDRPESSHPRADCSAEDCAYCAQQNHCHACFEELARRFQVPLLHFLIRRTGSRDEAEDLVQKTFLLAYRKLDRYRPAWRFSTWLFTLANRLAASHRRRRVSPRATGEASAETTALDPRAEVERIETQGAVWRVARSVLEPDAFTALWLSYVESMPAEQIGQVLGRNANAVRILLHRARARIAGPLAQLDHSGRPHE